MTQESTNRDSISSLFEIICSPNPEFKQISDLLLKQFCSSTYAILERPKESTSYHIVSSNDVQLSITEDELLKVTDFSIFNFDNAKTYNGLPNIKGVTIAPMSNDHLLILCSESNFDSSQVNSIQVKPFIQAYNFLLDKYKVDKDFFIAKAESYSDERMEQLSQRSYNVTIYHPSDLVLDTFAMFYRSGISTRAGIDAADLLSLLVKIRKHSFPVHYHNWFHVVDVAQFVFYVIIKGHLEKILDPDEIFALLLSAIGHDCEHNGLTNNYHRKTNSLYAHLSAPDLPPLEHHHSEMMIHLSRHLFSKLPEEKRDKIGHFIISCILATNMEIHKTFLEEFKSIQQTFDKNKPEHRLLLSQIILKSGDLSNTVRDFNAAEIMSKRLQLESFRQGDLEEKRGLPYSPMCDRHCKDPLCKGQIGFYKFVAWPLMNEINSFLTELSDNTRQYNQNLKRWEDLFEEWTAQ